MMFNSSLVCALGASFLVSLLGLIGVVTFFLRKKVLDKALILFVGFGAGGLIGAAFLHLMPEAIESNRDPLTAFIYVLIGFLFFFILEKVFFWRHCHEDECDVHPFTYLNIIGDTVHNFFDGLVIGSSFALSIPIGLVATLAIISHEIPHELGDFGILVYGGFTKRNALLCNFFTALTAVLGTWLGFYFSNMFQGLSAAVLPIAAGGFIYVAACDLIPEIHKNSAKEKSHASLWFFLLGIILMLILKLTFQH